jgi:exonuclease III
MQINYVPIENYIVGAEYCRQFFDGGGVCIFIHNALKFSNFLEFCKDKDFEVCTILLDLSYTKILVITVYRSPSGDFQFFLNRLGVIIKKFFQSDLKLIICGDINVNYLIDTEGKR